ncbi:MAG TPA: hypothetical protein VE134_04705, partial [Methanomicrobiales archaeon]|nr:hypothetical protein [Methanomicrobiales archaeon]
MGAGNGISVATDAVAVNLLSSAYGSGATFSESGLVFTGASSNELALIQGCSEGEILKWNDSQSRWYCATDQGSGSGSSKWTETTNLLYPNTSTVDVLFGGSTTASAKFAFTNVNLGTPTASISASSGDNATYITGAGNLATTNMQALTIGGSETGAITLDAGAGGITLSDAVTLSSVGSGSTNTVLILSGTNVIQSQAIDSRVWGSSSLVDGTGNPNQVAYWSDSNTIAGEDYLLTSQGGTGLNTSAAENGSLLIGNGAGFTLGYLSGGTGITIASSSGNITISHADLSTQGTVDNSGATVIQDVSMDTLGHVTGLSSVNLSTLFDNYQSWDLAADSGTPESIVSGGTATIAGGNGLTSAVSAPGTVTLAVGAGNGISVAADSISVNLLTSEFTTGATSSNYSGLEFAGASSNELTLLQGCTDGQILKWNDSTHVWYCSTDQGS